MHIGVYGSGYLATIVSACLADFGTPIICFDTDSLRIMDLAQGVIPFFEKNLKEVIRRNIRAGRLIYSTDAEAHASRAKVMFLCEDSPRYVEQSAMKLAELCSADTVLVLCTPVPVGTASSIEQRLRAAGHQQPVVVHPLFLTDGCAVEDFNWPDRILLGTRSSAAVTAIKTIYRPLVMRGVPVIVTNFETAELVREASTAFVATKISFINELASLCEFVKADAVDLALALGLDKRIAPRCLQPGVGFGGSFVEAEMDSLATLANGKGVALKILTAAREVNRSHSERIVQKIACSMESLSGSEIGLLGLAFKPNTNSVAGSSSIKLARRLVIDGAKVRAYDPVAIPDARAELTSNVTFCESAYIAAEGADALVVGTGWPEFRALDFERLKRLLRKPVIIDTKNLLDSERIRSIGFQYMGVGRA
ncbi:MAG TPA: nucleotide sugar dehydrogenase [Clostridia bacterium]|nr:nucleotide sugar dehydrogenase [Clostridia bacterium]